MTNEYISKMRLMDCVPKERIVEYMNEFDAGYNSCRNDMLRSIESLEPTDVVQIVRCRDCEYYGIRHWCNLNENDFNPDDFCSYGERREE